MKKAPPQNSHVSPAPMPNQEARTSADATPDQPPAPLPPSDSIAARLVPRDIREKKFRAQSFMAQLDSVERSTLLAWMKALSTREVVEKVAAPPPDGFGLKVCATTIDRLKSFVKNITPISLAGDALETAADLLENHQPGNIEALHEALHFMLYSSAVRSAAQGSEPKLIDQTLAALTRLEKLRLLRSPGSTLHTIQPSSAPATRHHVHLTISPVPVQSGPLGRQNVTRETAANAVSIDTNSSRIRKVP